MALTPEQERAVSIALADSFNADQKKNLVVALGNAGGGGGGSLATLTDVTYGLVDPASPGDILLAVSGGGEDPLGWTNVDGVTWASGAMQGAFAQFPGFGANTVLAVNFAGNGLEWVTKAALVQPQAIEAIAGLPGAADGTVLGFLAGAPMWVAPTVLTAGPGINIAEDTVSLELATPVELGGVIQVGEFDVLEEGGNDATDLATALVLLNSLKAKYNDLLTALADGSVIQPSAG